MTDQWPLNGADAVCATCNGRGTVTVDSGPTSCPACHAKQECGSCGRLVPATLIERLSNGRYDYLRCVSCRESEHAAYERAVA